MSRFLCLMFLLPALACGGSPPPAPVSATPAATPAPQAANDAARWPRDFVAGPGTGPALYLSADPTAPGIGYISEGTPIRIGSLVENGRIKVVVDGPLKVRGYLLAERLALRVAQDGRIPETPVRLSAGDYVRFVAPGEDEGLALIEATPNFGQEVEGAPSFRGVFPMDRLTTESVAVPTVEATFHRLPAGQAVELFARPDEVATTLPATDPGILVEVARDRGRWKGVRVGVGPRLVGYVNVDLTPTEDQPEQTAVALEAEGIPTRLQHDAERPLWRIAEGTRVRYLVPDQENGERITIALVEGPAYAREMGRVENDTLVDVFIAADNRVALRGTVPADALLPVESSE